MRDWDALLTQLTPDKAAEYRAQGFWGERRLCHQLDDAARRTPTRPAVVDRAGSTTYAELARASHEVAHGLVGLGVRAGDVVSWQLPNRREVVVLMAACSRIGAVFNSVAPIFREHEVATMLGLGEPAVVITVESFRGFAHAAMMRTIARDLRGTPPVVVLDGTEGDLAWSELVAEGRRRLDTHGPLPVDVPADTVAQLAFTSGTTGEPKGILHTHNSLLYGGRVIVERRALDADGVYHMASTLGHQTGILFGVLAPLSLGATMVLQDVWEAGEYLDMVETHGITMTNGATPYLQDTLERPDFADRDTSTLRQVGCFGSGFPSPLARQAARLLPRVTFYGIWGMTEVGLATSHDPGDPQEIVCDTDGHAVPPLEVAIRSEDLRDELGPDEEGEMVVRGPSRHLGFLQAGLAPAHFLEGDWYVTGDRGRLRPDGRLVMTARSKDIIVRGGENIPVLEIETALIDHPDVWSVAVVAVPDERLGERACACLVLRGDARVDLPELQRWLADKKITPQFWPEYVRVFPEFPVTPSGKIKKFALREEVATLGTPAERSVV